MPVNVTFEQLLKACSDGLHVINQKPKVKIKGKRENKNSYVRLASYYYFISNYFYYKVVMVEYGYLFREMDISTKKPIGGFREIIQAPKKVKYVIIIVICLNYFICSLDFDLSPVDFSC